MGWQKEELMETSETEEEITKRKLIELSESKPSRLSENAMYLRRDNQHDRRSDDNVENFSKKNGRTNGNLLKKNG